MRGRMAVSFSSGNGRPSPALEPISDIISQRANDANCKPGPEDAEQQYRIRAFYKFLVDQMGHGFALFEPPPAPERKCKPGPPLRLSPPPHTRVATRAWLTRSFMRALCGHRGRSRATTGHP